MRNDYLQAAQNVIQDPMILINVVSKRVKQLKFGERPLITSLERLEPEDVALREIVEGKISFKASSRK
jgi:DNA-directed RNA polymerase subunit omega